MYWNSPFGAEVYDRFVREWGLYRRLNAGLIRRSGLENANRVLDLGCGTGATTLACLEVLGARAEIVGVDASAAMVRLARDQIRDPRARFRVAEACRVHQEVSGSFDRVVCNAAFWQFSERHRVLAGVARLLAPRGRLVFNVPADRLEGGETTAHPFQVALWRELLQGESGPPAPPPSFRRAELIDSAARRGLVLRRDEQAVLSCRQRELMELMTIPPLIRPITPTLTEDERTELLARASRRVDPDEEVRVPWRYFSFERVAGGPPLL